MWPFDALAAKAGSAVALVKKVVAASRASDFLKIFLRVRVESAGIVYSSRMSFH
jgi:hypothetical protein